MSILDLFELNPASRIPQTSMKHLAGVRQEILDQINKTSLAYNNSKLPKTPPVISTQGHIKSTKPAVLKERMVRGHLMRAPSI